MTSSRVLTIFIVLLTIGCSTTKMQNAGAVSPEEFYSKIPFKYFKGVIGFDVKIDGETKTFLFDTGADVNVIQRDSITGKTSSYSGASKRKMELGKETVKSMRIGNVEFSNTNAVNGDFVGLKEQVPNFGGLIGQSIIGKANWLINYSGGSLVLSSRNLSDNSFEGIKTIRQNGNNPYTFLTFEGQEFKVIIDFGSSSILNLPEDSKFAKAVAQSIPLKDHTRDRYTLGGLQTVTEKIGVIPELKLGPFDFKDVHVNINTSSQPRVGARFFSDFLIYIDNSNGGVFKLKRNDVD